MRTLTGNVCVCTPDVVITYTVPACRVPLITYFHGAFQDSSHIYIVMEYCSGGDLLERLLKENRAMYEHRVAVEIAQPLLQSLAVMHRLKIIHRYELRL